MDSGLLGTSLLRVYELSASDCVAHFGKCCGILRGIGAQDYQIRFHSVRDSAVMVRISESPRWIRSERCQDSLTIHSRLRHKSELQNGIKMICIADIGAEQNVRTRLGVPAQFRTIFAIQASRCWSRPFSLRASKSNSVKVGISVRFALFNRETNSGVHGGDCGTVCASTSTPLSTATSTPSRF
jgi:hypothetical protein